MKSTMKIKLALLVVIGATMVGCGREEVSFGSLEEAKGTARENAMFNAQMYRQANVMYRGWDIIGRGDSTQDSRCPNGDGWATMEFVSPSKSQNVKVKCSTVSGNTGCLENEDFKTKPFASDDGACQSRNKVPYPLPKIAK